MSVIAVYSIKGGVGKTTTAFDLAWRMATAGGNRTLLWDLDLQGGAAYLLDKPQPRVPRAIGAFRPGGLLRQQVQATAFDRLFLLPADPSLRILPNQLARVNQRNRLDWMANFLSGEFRRIVLDCPPALNEVSDQVIGAADLIVVPLPPSPLSMRAFESIQAELAYNHLHPPPLFPVLTLYDQRRKLHREVRETIAADWPAVPFSSDIEQVAARRAPIDSFAAKSRGGQALAAVWEQVEARLAEIAAARTRRGAPAPAPAPASTDTPPPSVFAGDIPEWLRNPASAEPLVTLQPARDVSPYGKSDARTPLRRLLSRILRV